MADRVYPSAKPNPPAGNGNGAAANGGAAGGPAFPATKAQTYGANRMPYRPRPPAPSKRSRRSRRGCCACCLWVLLLLIALVFLAAIAGGIFYVIYRPHRPAFTVTSLRLSTLNISAAGDLTSRLDLNVTARNPNKKLVYLYDPSTIAVSSNGVHVGDGSFPGFVQGTKNTTLLSATVASSGVTLDSTAAADLKKSSVPLEIDLDTKAGIKIGSLKTKKIGIKVYCEGIQVAVPKGKTKPASSSPDAQCKVKLRIKIWKWTI